MGEKNKIYAFIDSQNLNLGIATSVEYRGKKIYRGWALDFKKFRKFLSDKYRVEKAYLFIGFVGGNESLYEYLQNAVYILIFKPTLEYKKNDKKFTSMVQLVVKEDIAGKYAEAARSLNPFLTHIALFSQTICQT